MTIDASINGLTLNDFTDNGVEIFYYEEPDYSNMSISESPANVESDIFIMTDFKKNPIDRLRRYSNITCRFKSDDGRVKYTSALMISYPLEIR